VNYPAAIDDVARQIRENVISRIESLTGLRVSEVNIAVTDLVFPEPEPPPTASAGSPSPAGEQTSRVQ
jgi:uncharacterized alkaline shock family protein YloU